MEWKNDMLSHSEQRSIRYDVLFSPIRDLSASTALHYITLPSLDYNSNYAQELHHLSRFPGPILRSMPVSLVLFQGLSEERLEEAAQANLQASQRGAWRHAGAD